MVFSDQSRDFTKKNRHSAIFSQQNKGVQSQKSALTKKNMPLISFEPGNATGALISVHGQPDIGRRPWTRPSHLSSSDCSGESGDSESQAGRGSDFWGWAMGSYGIIWDHMGSYGIMKNHHQSPMNWGSNFDSYHRFFLMTGGWFEWWKAWRVEHQTPSKIECSNLEKASSTTRESSRQKPILRVGFMWNPNLAHTDLFLPG